MFTNANTHKSIAFHNNLIVVSSKTRGDDKSNLILAMSLQAELMNLGYVLSANAFDTVSCLSEAEIIDLHNDIIPLAKTSKGVTGKKYSPLWKNFPSDVMEKSEAELYAVAIIHYWSLGSWAPTQELKARGYAFEKKEFIKLNIANEGWEQEIVNNLAGFNKPLDPINLKNLVWLCQNVHGIVVPEVSVKETMAALAVAGIKICVKTPVDVLRIAVGMSGGDIALPSMPKIPMMKDKSLMHQSYKFTNKVLEVKEQRRTFKFRKFTRAERKYILSLLESLKFIDVGEMQRHLGRWIRLGEILHPQEMAKQFPKSAEAFSKIRNQDTDKVRTFAGRVDLAFKESLGSGLKVLSERPGEFARRMDQLVRNPKYDANEVLEAFSEVVGKVSSKVLFEMFDHFEGRLEDKPRVIMVKGRGAKVKDLGPLPKLPKNLVSVIQHLIKTEMSQRAAKLPKMGAVFVDEKLRKMPIPFSMQSSSEGTSVLVRGTRMPINQDANTLRGFVHWYDENGQIDIDLSATFVDSKFNVMAECAFYDLKSSVIQTYHSGDVRHRIGHNAEYIDFNLDAANKAGIKYVIFSAYNYNGNSIKSVPECTFGVMERAKPKSNEIFEPGTAPQAVKLQASSNSVFPVVIDVENREWIWLDLESEGRGFATFHSNASTKKKLEAFLGKPKFSVYDLITMHVGSRCGTIVDNINNAEVVYAYSDIVRNYSKLTEFMSI